MSIFQKITKKLQKSGFLAILHTTPVGSHHRALFHKLIVFYLVFLGSTLVT